MRKLARPGIGEVVVSVACILVVLAALVAFDGRVRERASNLFTQVSTESAGGLGYRLVSLGEAVFDAARDRALAQVPMFVFVVAGGVLFVLMLRT
ncbi:MAG: hypothetical protein EHM13_15460 [Acidobacteria bacterium]|nr:MAG: hypothetical protein EHM13_15460 [Acidobacteriota bacterium]